MTDFKRRAQPFTARNYTDTRYSSFGGPLATAFGRLRVAAPFSVFDSKQLADNQPLFWNDVETSGGGTGSTHSTARASTTLDVSDATAGTRVRQTFQRFNYQPGKGQAVSMTGVLTTGASGITTRIGIYDANDGFMFETIDGAISINHRHSSTGSVVDHRILQADWNQDSLNGEGPSGITLDLSNVQIFSFDYQWLGTGRIRFGVDIEGSIVYVHEMHHSNQRATPHTSTPNLPLRCEIINDGTGPVATIEIICATVYSDGGQDSQGVLQYESTTSNQVPQTTHINANTADTAYALVGIQLKAAYLDHSVDLVNADILAETNTDFEWLVLFNPTVAGTFTFADKTNSACQTAIGNAANPSTNSLTALGTVLSGGLSKSSKEGGGGGSSISSPLHNALRLGSTIAGVADQIVLAVRPLAADADLHGGLAWRELS